MSFIIDDAAMAVASEAVCESAGGMESAAELCGNTECTFSIEDLRSEFTPSEESFDFSDCKSGLNSSTPASCEMDSLKSEFPSSAFSETDSNENFEQATPVEAVERTSTFDDQTIGNDVLEDKRPEIESKLDLGQPHNADVLRGNLEIAMDKETDRAVSRAHHIVGNETPNAARAMEAFGIDRNDPANGILLPNDASSPLKGSIHSGRHLQEYYNTVEQRMAMATTREEALEVLQSLKEDLFSGDLPLQRDVQPNL
jgi:hypothetical protein